MHAVRAVGRRQSRLVTDRKVSPNDVPHKTVLASRTPLAMVPSLRAPAGEARRRGEAVSQPIWHAALVATVAGLHHAALSVHDLDASSHWYRDVLGLEETFRQESEERRTVVMRFPGRRDTLGLVEHTGGGVDFDVRHIGLDHLAFRVESGEELEAWPSRLAERGIPYSGPIETPFGGIVHFTDLNGIALALFWERS